MSFEFVSVEDAKAHAGVRMTVVAGIPSPWSEAAKSILHVKAVTWRAIRHQPGDTAHLVAWTGIDNAPVLVLDDQSPKADWLEILRSLEQRYPDPALIPESPSAANAMLRLAAMLMSPDGLCWQRRLQLVAMGLASQQSAQRRHAEYIAQKYGFSEPALAASDRTIVSILDSLTDQLDQQAQSGSKFLIGRRLSAADIYLAATLALFSPLPPDLCQMDDGLRQAFGNVSTTVRNALSNRLVEHRDFIYENYLRLPLVL